MENYKKTVFVGHIWSHSSYDNMYGHNLLKLATKEEEEKDKEEGKEKEEGGRRGG